jgi:23S rRNA pseudouridine2605 synthase
MRLQKYLAEAGFGARRKCEQLIMDGRVTVNGALAQIGQNAGPDDDVRVDGQRIAANPLVYIALNKPEGYASDKSNPDARTVFDLAPSGAQLHAVGRLDKDSRGLVLLTNDGDLSFKLTHPRFEHEKEYRATVRGVLDAAALKRWRDGVVLDDDPRPTLPCEVRVERRTDDGCELSIIMREGRKRQIRRVAKLLGYPVLTLMRIRIGPLKLGRLELGRSRPLSADEIAQLRRYADA